MFTDIDARPHHGAGATPVTGPVRHDGHMSSSSSPVPPFPLTGGRAALLAVGMSAALALGACATGDDDEDPHRSPGAAATDIADSAAPTYARYVALGDSFAALGPTAEPTSGPAGCLRSTANYASVLAARDSIGELVDVTCGGAQTPDLASPQHADTPPQFDALTPDTDLVTLSLGGNDIGFGSIAGCVIRAPAADTGAQCRDQLEGTVTAELDQLGGRLDEAYDGIRERSPDARIVTTGYLPLIPDHGGCEFISGMSPGDVTWTRHIMDRIAMIVDDAADRAGAEVVLPDDADDRHACAPAEERYTDFIGVETGSHPMHPTAAGQRAMARAVADVL